LGKVACAERYEPTEKNTNTSLEIVVPKSVEEIKDSDVYKVTIATPPPILTPKLQKPVMTPKPQKPVFKAPPPF